MHYKVECFFFFFHSIVTLDLKALLMLLQDPDDDNFQLGERGIEVQFCAFCDALRVS